MSIVRYFGETDAELRDRLKLPTIHHGKLKLLLAKLGIKSAGSYATYIRVTMVGGGSGGAGTGSDIIGLCRNT